MNHGTIIKVNKATMRPLLWGGVEKRLVCLNVLIAFPLVAATHFRFPACFIGISFYWVLHWVSRLITKHDPRLMTLFRRSTRYVMRSYFPAKSHPSTMAPWKIKSIAYIW